MARFGRSMGPEVLTPALSAALEAPGGGLEQAVAHTALMGILPKLPRAPGQGEGPARQVRRFLVEAFGLRLALDLGESLEAAAPGISSLRQGLAGLAAWIDRAGQTPEFAARAPDPGGVAGPAGLDLGQQSVDRADLEFSRFFPKISWKIIKL